MAIAYEVRMYDVCSGNVIATYLGIAPSKNAAAVRCVARSSLTQLEKEALVNKLRWRVDSKKVDTQRWSFTIQADKTLKA